LEELTEDKEQAVWLDPEDMASRIPKEYRGPRFISADRLLQIQPYPNIQTFAFAV
jgi:hypothetical protein